MPTPAELVTAIHDALTAFDTLDDPVAPEQATFIAHLHRLINELQSIVTPMPQGADALRRLIPRNGECLLQQTAALFGYARLLVEHPASFAGATLSTEQTTHMQMVYAHGKTLYDLLETILAQAKTERLAQQTTAATIIDLTSFLENQLPILRYLVRDEPLRMTLTASPQPTICATVQSYHLAALLEHIVLVTMQDLQAHGHIRITSRLVDETPMLQLLCTGIAADHATWQTLFSKNGRAAYLRRLRSYGGDIALLPEAGRGARFVIKLASSSAN